MTKYFSALITALCIATSGCCGHSQLKPCCGTEVYFSPDGHVRDRIVKAIDGAQSSIDLAIFDFTSQEIKLSLDNAKKLGVKIRIVADSRQAEGSHSVVKTLVTDGFNVKIINGKHGGIMHNKFAIFDKKLLFTGSYNWTENAERANYENAVFIAEPETIKKYQAEFDKIWSIPVS